MRNIPEDKRKHYSKAHLRAIDTRNRLRTFKFVNDLVDIALKEMEERGKDVETTTDSALYKHKSQNPNGTVYLLIDGDGHLLDMAPIWNFVSEEKRKEYDRLMEQYSGD